MHVNSMRQTSFPLLVCILYTSKSGWPIMPANNKQIIFITRCLFARHHSKHLTCIHPFTPDSDLGMWTYCVYSYFTDEETEAQKRGPRATQLGSDKANSSPLQLPQHNIPSLNPCHNRKWYPMSWFYSRCCDAQQEEGTCPGHKARRLQQFGSKSFGGNR